MIENYYRKADDKFNCSNGVSIKKLYVCDDVNDCSDDSDETNELCAQNENGTYMNMDCGRVYNTNNVLINNGQKARYGTAPSNVGVYRFNERNSTYDLFCGGSIISSKLVVSAAHCFWKSSTLLSNRIFIENGLYKIGVGKYDRNINIVDNNFTQIVNVEIVYMHKYYFEYSLFHMADIAIIVLKNRVSFSNSVAPVCIDWNGKYNVVNGDQGKIVGWGSTNNDILSPILLEASLTYIDYTSCRNMYTEEFEAFITYDKFCGGSVLENVKYLEDDGNSSGNIKYGLVEKSKRISKSYLTTTQWCIKQMAKAKAAERRAAEQNSREKKDTIYG